MASKTIGLDEAAYERLKAVKTGDESFSDVVKRLTAERAWSDVTAILDETQAEALDTAIDEGRARSHSRRERLQTDLASATQRDTESDGTSRQTDTDNDEDREENENEDGDEEPER